MAQAKNQERGSPAVATLLAWFVPGAGHLYLGQFGAALLGFVLVAGLFGLGLRLSGGMTFEYLDPELRGTFSPLLSPEAGTLGGFVWQMRHHGFGTGMPRVFPETAALGSALCGIAGVLNVVWMVSAHLYARTGRLAASFLPARRLGWAWLVPGLGHLLQGRRRRAAVVFALLVGMFVVGTWLAEATNLSRERHFYYWAGQFMLGLPALGAEAWLGNARVTEHIPYVEAGLVYGCVAGLLNVLAMIDVYAWDEARELGLDPRTHETPQPVAAQTPAAHAALVAEKP
jgi:TM2 domain-containing membrane protein YozV